MGQMGRTPPGADTDASGYVDPVDAPEMLKYCLSKPGAWPDNPWGHEHPVVKVGRAEAGKIFAFLGADGVGSRAGRAARPPTSGSTATRGPRR